MSLFGFDAKDAKLIFSFFKMNVYDKYLGSSLGSAWAVANPLFMLAIFTFVFGYVFKVRLPGAETTLSYAIWLIGGYGPWIATAEGITGAAMSVVVGAQLVKNMAFKTEILPIAAVLTALLPLGVSMVFLAVLLVIDGNMLSWHAILVFIMIGIHFLFLISLGFFFSSITVFMRDFGIALPNLLIILLFATPIFYPNNSIPKVMQVISGFNPFYIISEGYRQVLIYHQTPGIISLLYVAGLSFVLGVFGLKTFRRVKGYFEAVL